MNLDNVLFIPNKREDLVFLVRLFHLYIANSDSPIYIGVVNYCPDDDLYIAYSPYDCGAFYTRTLSTAAKYLKALYVESRL